MLRFGLLNNRRRFKHFGRDPLLVRYQLGHLSLRPNISLPVLEFVVKSYLQVRIHILRKVALLTPEKVNHMRECFWIAINENTAIVCQLVRCVS